MLAVSRGASRRSGNDVTSGALAGAPSIQPTQAELAADVLTGKPLDATAAPAIRARADQLAE
jgi:hypothetical protein